MSEETNKKKEETLQKPNGKNSLPVKKIYSKEVLERARKIQAARRTEELKKASEERKVRIAKQAEDKKTQEDTAKAAPAKKAGTPSSPASKIELTDFAVTARKYKTQLTRKFKERKFWVDPSPYEILSYIPGTIISVDAKVGKIVEEGEQLLILEAMKMQNRVDMPFTARIKKINVKAGEKIPKDFVMIELEPIDN